jgi:hypothetical protein
MGVRRSRKRSVPKGAKRPQSFLTAEKLTGAVVFANVINLCVAVYMSVGLGGVQFNQCEHGELSRTKIKGRENTIFSISLLSVSVINSN